MTRRPHPPAPPIPQGPPTRRRPAGPAPLRRTPRRGRSAALLAAVLAAGALLAGCGIRSTSVPVDAGAAPSRVGCVVPGANEGGTRPQETVVRVYLVCGSRVAPVQRAVRLPGARVDIARTLLDELTAKPGPDEAAAGFDSRVPDGLGIAGGVRGDPEGTLRLSVPPAELPSFALAQLVCTFAETGAGVAGGSVLLGGPADGASEPVRRLECGTALRSSPDAAATAGSPVRPTA